VIAGRPAAVAVPEPVRQLAGDAPVTAVWRNELGGLTFRVGDARYVKWSPHNAGIDLSREAARLAWAGQWLPVPRVLDRGSDATASWLVTAALPGRSAVDEHWLGRPAEAAARVGAALRLLHDTLPVAECPFSWSAGDRIGRARGYDEAWWRAGAERHPAAAGRSKAELLELLAAVPPVDRLVVCHGDACVPNVLLEPAGFVDLGSLGVADRWADLAVCSWSLEWNHGPGHQEAFFAGYRIEPDPERIGYYRLLWDLS